MCLSADTLLFCMAGSDIMTQIKGLNFDECLDAAKTFEDDDLKIRTINIQHFLEAKRAAGRHKDLDDIEYLE